MKPSRDAFELLVRDAVDERSVAGTARAYGLPRDAIRSVLKGHDPRLSRADEICRALSIRFCVGPKFAEMGCADFESDYAGPYSARYLPNVLSPAGPSVASRSADGDLAGIIHESGVDWRLRNLIDRLTDEWGNVPPADRDRFVRAVEANIELASQGGRFRY